MKLFELVTKEFLSIVDVLRETEPVENERIMVDKERFKKLLEKYNYLKFRDKTQIYKSLNFILHDKNNYTLPCKDHTINKTVRKVVINYKAYETIKHLMETDVY